MIGLPWAVISLMEVSDGLSHTASDGGTRLANIASGIAQLLAKLALTGVLVWLCIRTFMQTRQKTPDPATDASQSSAHGEPNRQDEVEARRKSAWERQQARLDEQAAAAYAAKQKCVKVKEDAQAAAAAVKEARERARVCTRVADEARMRRRRAGDQLRLSADDENRRIFEERQRDAEECIQEEKQASDELDRAVARLEELRNWLLKHP